MISYPFSLFLTQDYPGCDVYYKPDPKLYDRFNYTVGTLPVESVGDPSEYLPTRSTQTPLSGL